MGGGGGGGGGGLFCLGSIERRGSCASRNAGEREEGLKNDPIRPGVWMFSEITHSV